MCRRGVLLSGEMVLSVGVVVEVGTVEDCFGVDVEGLKRL